MEGDTLVDSDSGSFDSLTFLPRDQCLDIHTPSLKDNGGEQSKKRAFDSITTTATSDHPSSPAIRSALHRDEKKLKGDSPKKRRKVSFADDVEEREGKETAQASSNSDKKLSAEEIEEMRRKTEHWWNLPATTTQEEFEFALENFKDGLYFQAHMDVEWLDVLIQRACGRLLSQDQFSAAAQDMCAALHAALTRSDTILLQKLIQDDAELQQLCTQYKEASSLMQQERQKLTDKFGIIHSVKIAIKSEVYVCSATRLKQAGKEVTDSAVEEELAAFERGVSTVPGSNPQGGCVMAQYWGRPASSAAQGCPVQHDASRPQPEEARVCPFTGHKVPTRGDDDLQARGEDVSIENPQPQPVPPGVCPFTGHKPPTCGDVGVQAREEDEEGVELTLTRGA